MNYKMRKPVIYNFKKDELDSFVEDANSCVRINNSTYSLALYPYHLSNVSESIKRLLNAKVAKYDQRLDGILLGYRNLKLITPHASLRADSCYIHVDIQGDFYIFKPKVGAKLTGVVNKTSSNHIGCLVHKVFNVSVPNKNGDENWLGSNVQIGDIVELSVLKIDLDSRLPYIMASITDYTSSNNYSVTENGDDTQQEIQGSPNKKRKRQSFAENDETINDSTQMNESIKQKKKKKRLSTEQIENILDVKVEELSQKTVIRESPKKSPKKEKKRKSLENTPNNNDQPLSDTLNESPKKVKKRKSLENTSNNNDQPLSDTLNESPKKSPKKEQKRKSLENTLNNNGQPLNESPKKSPKKEKKRKSLENPPINNDQPLTESSTQKQKKKRLSVDQTQNAQNIVDVKMEEFSQKTVIPESPKKRNTPINNESQHTNETDYFVTPKNKKKQKQLKTPELEKGSMEDFIPKEPKEKKPPKKRKSKNENEEATVNKPEPANNKKKRTKKNQPATTSPPKLNSANKKKQAKLDKDIDTLLLLTEHLQSLKETKKDSSLNNNTLSPIKPMADHEDRTTKKTVKRRVGCLSQTIDWQNKELNLYDSDLEKTLNTNTSTAENTSLVSVNVKETKKVATKNKKNATTVNTSIVKETKNKKNKKADKNKTSITEDKETDKTLEFNLAKITALNANTPRKKKERKVKPSDQDQDTFVHGFDLKRRHKTNQEYV